MPKPWLTSVDVTSNITIKNDRPPIECTSGSVTGDLTPVDEDDEFPYYCADCSTVS
jgi:hypothetical protein